jgi:hypothetical protein
MEGQEQDRNRTFWTKGKVHFEDKQSFLDKAKDSL